MEEEDVRRMEEEEDVRRMGQEEEEEEEDGEEHNTEEPEAVVDVHVLDSHYFFVWKVEGVIALRRKYRVIGSPLHSKRSALSSAHQKGPSSSSSSSPAAPPSNVPQLPLLLLPEEVDLGLRKGWIRLWKDDYVGEDEEEGGVWEARLDAQEHEALLREEEAQRKAEYERVKRLKEEYFRGLALPSRRQQRKQTKNEGGGGEKGQEEGAEEIEGKKRKRREAKEERQQHKKAGDAAAERENVSLQIVQMTTSSSFVRISTEVDERLFRRRRRRNGTGETVGEISLTKWQREYFPRTDEERMRSKVFADLWERGYYITTGTKFGGDYLVYLDEPLCYHASFVVRIVAWEEEIEPLQLIAFGRLGATVKKSMVFASVHPSNGSIRYITIDWRGVT
ncbi:tRNA-splicing endonuclease subunit [Balamuthia mandrillaris]